MSQPPMLRTRLPPDRVVAMSYVLCQDCSWITGHPEVESEGGSALRDLAAIG